MGQILSIEDREDRDAQFIREFVNNGGNATLRPRLSALAIPPLARLDIG